MAIARPRHSITPVVAGPFQLRQPPRLTSRLMLGEQIASRLQTLIGARQVQYIQVYYFGNVNLANQSTTWSFSPDGIDLAGQYYPLHGLMAFVLNQRGLKLYF